jgi:glycosyltransferase involved in cell wall biosynthesis
VFTLVAAGPFPDSSTEQRFAALAAQHPGILRHVGFANAEEKSLLFAASRCLLFPTRYSAETFSLVALEALAHDRPIVATRWRALPEIVAPECGRLVEVGDHEGLVAALLAVCAAPPAAGVCRARFLREFTRERHASRLRAALLSIA